jgi:hypothetical protein
VLTDKIKQVIINTTVWKELKKKKKVTTQLQLAYFRVMVSFLEHGSEAYGFIISGCSEALYCCATVIER